MGDFNAKDFEPCLSEFIYDYNADNIVKEKTCTFLELILTLKFQNTCAITTGLSDFQKVLITIMKMTFLKNPLRKDVLQHLFHLIFWLK